MRRRCEDFRPHAWSMCASCVCPRVARNRETQGKKHDEHLLRACGLGFHMGELRVRHATRNILEFRLRVEVFGSMAWVLVFRI